ncbi:hypothetical protein ITP53_46195 [Nonomuraea sp. K274]|uniref:Uncharacterized protein n=1 Tax=Nonomuraea cypriaca TaxID=1187855 RepID=A0A931F2G7_9ACTN|nr:hypothetical protein [Nonomuraea cypriaca]MBF8192949.1 hypothetical protein [Nonomuraea cypriaca]
MRLDGQQPDVAFAREQPVKGIGGADSVSIGPDRSALTVLTNSSVREEDISPI